MKRQNDNASSLEMLLDTMCNTFGAVVFLCITLAVLLSLRVEQPQEPVVDKTELNRLQLEFAAAVKKVAELTRIRHLSLEETEIVRQTQQVETRRVAIRKARLKTADLELQIKNLERPVAELSQACRQLERELTQLSQERQKQELSCRELQKDAASQKPLPEMNFSRREQSQSPPYYFIVTPAGVLHRVGLEFRNGAVLPAEETDYRQLGRSFVCQAKQGCGRPLMRSETEVNPEVWPLLEEVKKQGKRPYFLLAKEAAPQFYHFRFALRQKKIIFGWDPLPENGCITITPVRQAHWDYGQ